MPFRGRFQLGQEVPLYLLCQTPARVAALPDSPPVLDVWSTSAKVKAGVPVPVFDRYGATGLFRLGLFLDGVFTTGTYRVEYRYQVGGVNVVEEDTFEILPGGDPKGAVIAMYSYSRPHANFVVYQLTGGGLTRGRNPSV